MSSVRPIPRRPFGALVLAVALGAASGPVASLFGQERWPLEEVAPGVYAALQEPAARFQDSNSLVVVTERDVIVVDAQADASSVERLHRSVVALTDKPIRWIVNTHWHSDHTQGNAVWRRLVGPELGILAHDSLHDDVPERAAVFVAEEIARLEEQLPLAEAALAEGKGLAGQELDEEQQTRQRAAIDGARERLEQMRRVELLEPTVGYRRRLVLHRDTGDVVLLHFRAHTRGDTVVWLPQQRVLATGDLLDDLPYGGHGYPSSWRAALDDIAALDFEVVVPGHGPVQRSRERLELARALWSTLLEQLTEQHDRGRGYDDAVVALDLEELRVGFTRGDETAERAWEEFLPSCTERVWAEITGTLDTD